MTTEETVKFKHTPGPWVINHWKIDNYKGCQILDDLNNEVCMMAQRNNLNNSKLISLSPDFYDLAQAVLTLEKGDYSKEIVFEMARVILNKLK